MVVKPASPIHQRMQTRIVLIKIIIVNDAGSSLHVKFTKNNFTFSPRIRYISFKLSHADPEGEGAIAS